MKAQGLSESESGARAQFEWYREQTYCPSQRKIFEAFFVFRKRIKFEEKEARFYEQDYAFVGGGGGAYSRVA